MTQEARTAVQVDGKVVTRKRVGAYQHLTLVAPGVAERFRPGAFVTLSVDAPASSLLLPRALAVYRARATGAYGGTVELVFSATDSGTSRLARLEPGDPVAVVGPLGRPFALPKEPVACALVGHGRSSAPLFSLAERLRERGCAVHMLLGAATEDRLFGALEAKRSAQSVLVTTEDGSVGIKGSVADPLPDLLSRSAADVVYGAGPTWMLHAVAVAAEEHGAWSQTAVEEPVGCGTGVCLACVLPVVGEDGVSRMARSCVEGPVFRGDRVRWRDVGTVPADAWGAPRGGGPGG